MLPLSSIIFRLSSSINIVIVSSMKHPLLIHFVLGEFTGSLENLLGSVQSKELDISSLNLHSLTAQYREIIINFPPLVVGTDFIYVVSSLAWIKSNQLLPKHEVVPLQVEEELLASEDNLEDSNYCSIKKAAKTLVDLEQKQNQFFSRAFNPIEPSPKGLGIDHLSLQDLVLLFQNVLKKATGRTKLIQDEEWQVAILLENIRDHLQSNPVISFNTVFDPEKSREELIATFLAILELMKSGEIKLIKAESGEVAICRV